MDALKRDLPMWGSRTDLRVEGDCATVLQQVPDAVLARADDAYRARIVARMSGWQASTLTRQQRVAEAAAKTGTAGAIGPGHVCAAIARYLRPDDILVNEAIRNTVAVMSQMPRTQAGTYFANAGGGLGFSGGAALGLRLANPGRRVIQVVGDGTFHFSAPDAVFADAQQYALPVLTVVLDNRGWSAVKQATLRMYPQGRAAATGEFRSVLDSGRQGEERRFGHIARAFGGHGEYVDNPALLDEAITRCPDALEQGRAALLHVRVTPL